MPNKPIVERAEEFAFRIVGDIRDGYTRDILSAVRERDAAIRADEAEKWNDQHGLVQELGRDLLEADTKLRRVFDAWECKCFAPGVECERCTLLRELDTEN